MYISIAKIITKCNLRQNINTEYKNKFCKTIFYPNSIKKVNKNFPNFRQRKLENFSFSLHLLKTTNHAPSVRKNFLFGKSFEVREFSSRGQELTVRDFSCSKSLTSQTHEFPPPSRIRREGGKRSSPQLTSKKKMRFWYANESETIWCMVWNSAAINRFVEMEGEKFEVKFTTCQRSCYSIISGIVVLHLYWFAVSWHQVITFLLLGDVDIYDIDTFLYTYFFMIFRNYIQNFLSNITLSKLYNILQYLINQSNHVVNHVRLRD